MKKQEKKYQNLMIRVTREVCLFQSNFLHFLKKYVGAEWMMELQENQLSLCDKEFIDIDYEGREADLLYKVVGLGGQDIYIYILQEMQSTVDFTMIFRLLVYIVNNLTRIFISTPKSEREKRDFRLPAVVPIVFYNGEERWTAVRKLKEYQAGGELFGEYILNLEYYLVNLAEIEQEDILATNMLIDNIMYCDKFRNKEDLLRVIPETFRRMEQLDRQDKEEFKSWAKNILIPVCGLKEAAAEEILARIQGGVDDMAFEHNLERFFRENRERAIAEGHAEGLARGHAEGHAQGRTEEKIRCLVEVLEEMGPVPEQLLRKLQQQDDLEILDKWFKGALKVNSIREFEEILVAKCKENM